MKTDLISCLFSKFEKYKIILYPRFLSETYQINISFFIEQQNNLETKEYKDRFSFKHQNSISI